jgi:hypothetical protein
MLTGQEPSCSDLQWMRRYHVPRNSLDVQTMC